MTSRDSGELRTLGRTNLPVTTLGYGAMELRGAPRGRPITKEQAGRVLNGVLDAGINYIDTSIDYGVSEELIGETIGHRRHEYLLASKCGCWALPGEPETSEGGRSPHVFTRENIIAGVNQSLRRMKTDYLDLVQVHASPSRQVLEREDVVGTLKQLQAEGKVRFIGMSGTLPNLPDHIDMQVFDVFQIPYSALERKHEDLITKAAEAGAGTVIRGGVAKGAGGKQTGDAWQVWQRAGLDDLLDEGMSPQEFILRFTLSHPGLHTTIVGSQNLDHVLANVDAYHAGPLPADVYREAKRRLTAAR